MTQRHNNCGGDHKKKTPLVSVKVAKLPLQRDVGEVSHITYANVVNSERRENLACSCSIQSWAVTC